MKWKSRQRCFSSITFVFLRGETEKCNSPLGCWLTLETEAI